MISAMISVAKNQRRGDDSAKSNRIPVWSLVMSLIETYAVSAGSALLSSLLLVVLYRLLQRRSRFLKHSSFAIHAVFILLPVYYFLSEPLSRIHARLPLVMLAMLVFLGVHLAIRLLDTWLFEMIFAKHRHAQVPVVVRDLLRWLLSAVALLVIVRSLFPEVNLNVLAVSSIVVGYILGNATQDTLGNLVSGLALNTESPFAIGDWVTIAGNTGRIQDMTWRATSLRTKAGDYITIPNAAIARETITNFSQPTTEHGCYLDIGVNYGVAPAKVRSTLMEAIRSVPAVLAEPVPKIRLVRYGDFSIDYKIKFYIDDYEQMEEISSRIMERIWYHFKRDNIVIPFPIRDVNMRQVTAEDERRQELAVQERKATQLDAIDLFRPLPADDRRQLAGALEERMYGPGEVIVEEGGVGSAFFIIASGSVEVTVLQNGRQVPVATLSAGDFFGEMSFLTGDKINATIRASGDCTLLALRHTELASILAANSALADDFATILARRQQSVAQSRAQAGAVGSEAATTIAIGKRIRRFFGLA
jgi:small-conductance mechanosensitive channel/CRP-like cAMP-binding protein